MLLKRFTDFVLQSRVQAMATAFVIAFIPIIGSISILIAALVTLRKGALEGALVVIAATLPYVIGYFTSPPAAEQFFMAVGMLGVIIISNILTWVFAIVLRRFSNWSFTIEFAALLGVLAIGIVHIIFPDIQSWWETQLTSYFTKAVEAADAATNKAPTLTVIQAQAVAAAKQFATGFIVVSVLFNALLQLLIARWWQAVMFNPGGLRQELYQIRLSYVAGLIFAAALIAAYLGNAFALDAMPVLFAAFFVSGLSLLHTLFSHIKTGWIWLILIYAGIIWLFPLSIVIIAIMALMDTGLDFRKRFQF